MGAEIKVIVFCIVFFFGGLFGLGFYDSYLKNNCRITAINKGLSAIETQAICK